MSRLNHVTMLLLFLPVLLLAQPPAVLWTTTTPDLDASQLFDSVVHTTDGFIFAWSRTYVGSFDPSYLYKFDADGEMEWYQEFSGDPMSLENGMIVSDGADGLYLCGTSNHDIQVTHLDTNGDPLWTVWDPDSDVHAYTMALTRLADGGIAVASEADDWPSVEGVGVSIFTADGEFSQTTVYDFGSLGVDVESIIQLMDGSLVVGGSDLINDRAYLLRVDTEGNLLWQQMYTDGFLPEIYDLAALPNGNFIVCGDLTDDWIAEITPEGNTVWESLGVIPGRDVELLPGGGFVFADELTIYHTDNLGEFVWAQTVGGLPYDSEFRAACVTETGGVIAAGGSRMEDTLAIIRLEDITVPPITLTLIPQGSTSIPASGGTLFYDARVQLNRPDPVNGQGWTKVLLPNGQLFGPLLLRPVSFQPGETYLSGGQLSVPALAPAGTYQLIGNLGIYPNFIAVSDILHFTKEAGNTVTGTVTAAEFDGVFPSREIVHEEELIASVDTPLPETATLGELYPNPTNGTSSLTVTLPEAGEMRAELYDVTGRFVATVYDGSVSAGNQAISVETDGLASGTYLLRVTIPGQLDQTRRLVLLK